MLRKLFRKRKAATALIPATMFCRDQRADAISSAKSKEEHCQNKQGRYEILRLVRVNAGFERKFFSSGLLLQSIK